jgi:hypothetical protein
MATRQDRSLAAERVVVQERGLSMSHPCTWNESFRWGVLIPQGSESENPHAARHTENRARAPMFVGRTTGANLLFAGSTGSIESSRPMLRS